MGESRGIARGDRGRIAAPNTTSKPLVEKNSAIQGVAKSYESLPEAVTSYREWAAGRASAVPVTSLVGIHTYVCLRNASVDI